MHVRRVDPMFYDLKGVGDLAKAFVKTNLMENSSLVYLLVKFIMILSIAVEEHFHP